MKSSVRRGVFIALAVLVAIPTFIMPLSAAIIYEAIFARRYSTADWVEFSLSDYPSVRVEGFDFYLENTRLAGFKYSREDMAQPKALVIMAHGLGGGGHNVYFPFIDCLTEAGYLVFAYDAPGNDASEGKIGGLPRGIAAMDAAIEAAKSDADCENLPILLFGHSWGAYSAAAVLNLHPEIAAAAIISGFDESEDMLRFYASSYVGPLAGVSLPYVKLYERIKFGRLSELSGLEGLKASNAEILIAHSLDDGTVPVSCGYEEYLAEFSEDERFCFLEFTSEGHNRILYSAAADAAVDKLNADYRAYVEANGGEHTEELKLAFMDENPSKLTCFQPDEDLMGAVLAVFEEGISKNLQYGN